MDLVDDQEDLVLPFHKAIFKSTFVIIFEGLEIFAENEYEGDCRFATKTRESDDKRLQLELAFKVRLRHIVSLVPSA